MTKFFHLAVNGGTVRVERTRHGYERWACAVRATAGSPQGSVTDASASSWFPCPRWERRTTIDAEDGPESREVGSSSSGGATRGPHSAPHVLFALSHAWRVSAVDSGTGGSPELGDHAAVYAPDSSHVRGDGQAAESTNRCPRCWRHIGNGAIADDELTDSTRVKWWRRRESNPTPFTPVGSKGIGEPPVGAGAGAVLCAIADAMQAVGDGYFHRSPVSRDMILTELEQLSPAHGRLTTHV